MYTKITNAYNVVSSALISTKFPYSKMHITREREREKERERERNDALNTFYLRLYGVRHMVKDHSDSEKGNPLPPYVSVAEWLAWLTSNCGRIGAIGSSPSNGLKPNLCGQKGFNSLCQCVYIYVCIVNPDIQTIHRYSHTSIHTYIHTYIHTSIHT